MATRKYIELLDGRVQNTLTVYRSDADVPPELIEVPATTDLEAVRGCAYDVETGAFGEPSAEEHHFIRADEFYDLFTFEQRARIFDLEETGNGDTQVRRQVRDYVRRVNAGGPIDLRSPRVGGGLLFLKSLGVFGADEAVAYDEIARILAGVEPAA